MDLRWLEGRQGTLFHPYSLLLLFFSFLFFLRRFIRSWVDKPNLPPSPPKLPIIGNLHQLGKLAHRSLGALSQKYGPLMLMHLGSSPTIVVSSVEMAREITKTHDIVFSNRVYPSAAEKLLYGCKDLGFSPYGEYWRQVRKISVLHLLSIKRVESFEYIRREEIATIVEKISSSCRVGKAVNLTELLKSLSSNVISRVAVGRKYGEEDDNNKLPRLTRELVDLLGAFSMRDLFPLLGWIDILTGLDGRIKRNSKALDALLDQVIDDHIATKRDSHHEYQEDFVDILLQAQKDATVDQPLERDNIKALILDMFVAGTDTPSVTMEWVLSEIAKNPKVMKKAQEEVRRVVGKKFKVEMADINKLDYLNCVIKETLRLHPPGALLLPRASVTAVNIEGYYIPSKTRVLINAWAIQRDPRFWDNPEEFIPERFVDNPIDFIGQDHQYLPFGSGRRVCPGIAFGLAAVESAVANLLYWFDWELVGDANKQDYLDMTEVFGITLCRKTPLYLRPKVHFS